MRFNFKKQAGHTDLQIMPAMIGAVIVIAIAGQIGQPGFESGRELFKPVLILILGIGSLLYGFGMHIYCLGYPASPFNRHSSPVLMTILSAGPVAYTAWRFYSSTNAVGFVICSGISLLIMAATIGFAYHRYRTGNNQHE